MSPTGHSLVPVVSVVHFEVGPHTSISIEQFLRSLKRDRKGFPSNRWARKRRRLNQREPESQAQPSLGESLIPALVDDAPVESGPTELDIEVPSESRGPDFDEDIEGAKKNWASRSTSRQTRVRNVYKGKHKNITPAVSTSDLTPAASLPSDRQSNILKEPLHGTFFDSYSTGIAYCPVLKC